MFLIIMHHFADPIEFDGFGSVWLGENVVKFFILGGKIGVNLFLLISGYFLITSKFKFSKVFLLVGQVAFYSLIYYIIELCCHQQSFNLKELIKTLIAAAYPANFWFITTYLVLYLLSPFLNVALNSLNRKQHLTLLGLLLALQTGAYHLIHFSYLANIGWFITMYSTGAFFRKYQISFCNKKHWMLLIFVTDYLAMTLLNIFTNRNLGWQQEDILCVIASLSLFCFFQQLKIQKSWINVLASTTFGIYLIHSHRVFHHWVWRNIFHSHQIAYSPFFIFYAFGSCLAVFIFCLVVDLLRQYLLEKPIRQIVLRYRTKKHESAPPVG